MACWTSVWHIPLSIIWLLIICERRVSKECNRVEWHSSVHHNIISSSCPLNWTDKVIPWGVRPNFIANELKTWWQLFLLALVRIWDFLPATGHKWILIPLVLAVSALVEDIFSREATKLGTHFSVKKLITTEGRWQCPGFLLIFRQFGYSSVFRRLFRCKIVCVSLTKLLDGMAFCLPHFNLRSYFRHHCDHFYLHYILLPPGLQSR